MKFFPVLIISVLAEQCHELLQVAPSTRDEAVLKRAYRKAALKWHPDKNTAPEAVEKFRRVADCYEEMVSGRDGSTGFSRSREPRSRRDAETMFNDFFGDVWRRWQPGSKTVGSFVRNGKKVQITIWEDGSSEEVVSEGRGDYTVLSESSPGSYQLHIQGNPFEILAQQMETFLPAPLHIPIQLIAQVLGALLPFLFLCCPCLSCMCILRCFKSQEHPQLKNQ
mmetsp:Transcript_62043/g.142810  ORF Transcript_62043/g.142810 Transcript_62043/m.142810 type:complete len:223 (+) Transcript_62043:25-693(+)